MAVKKKGLGKGLDALFAVENVEKPADLPEAPSQIALVDIDPNPDQPRKTFDPEKLAELADSIRIHGLLQPLVVTPRGHRYMLVAGERRWRASREAGLSRVPAVVLSLDDKEIAEVSLVENLQRDDLNPLEESLGIAQLMKNFSLTQEETAERIGRSRPAVANALRLLQLAPAVQALVREGSLSAGHARTLLPVSDEAQQTALAQKIIAEGLSVRQTEELVRLLKDPKKKKKTKVKPTAVDPGFGELESRLRQALGTKVTVNGTLEKGKIVLEYYQRDDLERIFEIATQLTSGSDSGF